MYDFTIVIDPSHLKAVISTCCLKTMVKKSKAD